MFQPITEAERVLIRGKVFLYKQKAPFVPSGKSVYGALEYDEATDRVRCHECGEWFLHLPVHIARAHGITSIEYKETHGLRKKTSLCGLRLSATFSAGKEKYYDQLRARCGTDEGRKAFGAVSRNTTRKRVGSRAYGVAEKRNETGHCKAQLLSRLSELVARCGRSVTMKQIIDAGISPGSACLAFNVSSMNEVLGLLKLGDVKKDLKYSKMQLVEILRDYYAKWGSVPSNKHVKAGVFPNWCHFKLHFGTMAAAYEAAGLALVAKRAKRAPAQNAPMSIAS